MLNSLYSWRNVIIPHADVREGRWEASEFMADLGQAAKGEGTSDYTDARDFFGRTYLTGGLRRLLVTVLKRLVYGAPNEPVIKLKTAFGGGKTHSMLAIYHLLSGKAEADTLPGVRSLLDEAGIYSVPRVKTAVLACTSIDPAKPQDVCGERVNTLCGNMAAQLGGYDFVREADKKSVPPGNEALARMFDACGPCLVLIDELAAYGRVLYGADDLPAGTFGAFQTFIQQLTEAAKFSRRSLVAATMPESKLEYGGDDGEIVLRTLEHIFGRIESVWRPATPDEGFEIVRRRLFLDCKDTFARDKTVDEFYRMYQENPGDFPAQTRTAKYRDRLAACYPFHPELFDHLYGEWSALDGFQRTRGVLKLMAAAVHRLWVDGDANALIMSGNMPLYDYEVRNCLTSALPSYERWDPVIERDIDGPDSKSAVIDGRSNMHGEISAARRSARAVMLGSAPGGRARMVRGIDSAHVRLGTVQPGENIAAYNTVLHEMRSELSYLYTDEACNRLWFDTRPTLRKMAHDREALISDSETAREIERRLHKVMIRKRPFAGVHIYRKEDDVPDDKFLRVVVLMPGGGEKTAENILAGRTYKNMLVFLEADMTLLEGVRRSVRSYLAWQMLMRDRETLTLDSVQEKEIRSSIEKFDGEADAEIRRAWNCVLSPHTDREKPGEIAFDRLKVSRAEPEDVISEVIAVMRGRDKLSGRWAGSRIEMDLAKVIWDKQDDIRVGELWEHTCRYCDWPRLESIDVLFEGVREGVQNGIFAYASGKDGGRYLGLRVNDRVSEGERMPGVMFEVNTSGYIVRRDVAQSQIAAERVKDNDKPEKGKPAGGGETPPQNVNANPQVKRNFYLSMPLADSSNPQKSIKDIFEYIVSNLKSVDGGNLRVSLEISFDAPAGIPGDIAADLAANCRDLKLKDDSYNLY